MTGTALDPGRVARAVHLQVSESGPRKYTVSGGAQPHVVQAGGDGGLRCDCTDHAMRPAVGCKHILAVRLRLADADVLAALRVVVALPKRHRKRGRR
jgi:hypothetical protein